MSALLAAMLVCSPGLEGVWVADRPLDGAPFEGVIEVDRRPDGLSVWVAGDTFSAEPVGAEPAGAGRWRAATPDGEATAQLELTGDRLTGFWVQAPMRDGPQPWSTPLRFTRVSPDRWRANVRPYHPRFPLTLAIHRDQQGRLRALARDPERNRGLFLRLASVEVDGDGVRFVTRDGESILARRPNEDTLALMIWGRPLTLIRARRRATRSANPANADGSGGATRPGAAAPPVRGFRASLTKTYVHRTPSPDRDWPAATFEAHGLNAQPVLDLLGELAAAEPRSVYDPQVHAVLVAHRGALVVEAYFFGHGPAQLHDTRSAGKSLGSMLFGAVAQRLGREPKALLEARLCGEVPGYRSRCETDRRKRKITFAHLLSMRSGLACDDDAPDSPGNEDLMQRQRQELDWYRYAIGLPMARDPGVEAVYCTAGINLAGAALRRWTGRPVAALFDELLARPLGVEHYHHNLSPVGDGYLGGGLRLRPRDLLKFGEVMRLGGAWKGRRVLPEAWVDLSTQPVASINRDLDYAYGWWRSKVDHPSGRVDTFYASGNGGQLLFVLPRLELVVLFNGGNYGNFGTWRRFIEDDLPRVAAIVSPRAKTAPGGP